MSLETFQKVCDLVSALEINLSLGGGEPTLHPQFWQFFGLALKATAGNEIGVFVATNGSIEDSAVALAQLAQKGVLCCRLSIDQFHDVGMVSDRVSLAFSSGKKIYSYGSTPGHDYREVVKDSIYQSATGRASSWGTEFCVCEDIVVEPNGRMFSCGCRVECVGDIHDPESYANVDWYEEHRCARFGRAEEK